MLAGYKTPQKVYSADGVQAYLSHTQNFSGKESTLQIGLISELPIINLDNSEDQFAGVHEDPQRKVPLGN